MPDTKLTVDDVTGVVGIIPTPSTPTADRADTANSVDLDDETVRVGSRRHWLGHRPMPGSPPLIYNT